MCEHNTDSVGNSKRFHEQNDKNGAYIKNINKMIAKYSFELNHTINLAWLYLKSMPFSKISV